MTTYSTTRNGLKAVHVVWASALAKWQVKDAGNSTVLYQSVTKQPAVDWARSRAKAIKGELVVHNQDGTIASRDSYGNDPFPPRG